MNRLRFIIVLGLFFSSALTQAQSTYIDSLRQNVVSDDTSASASSRLLYEAFSSIDADSSAKYALLAAYAYDKAKNSFQSQAWHVKAIEEFQKSGEMSKADSLLQITKIYVDKHCNEHAQVDFLLSRVNIERSASRFTIADSLLDVAYTKLKNDAYADLLPKFWIAKGNVDLRIGNLNEALSDFREALNIVHDETGRKRMVTEAGLGLVYSKLGMQDSALTHFKVAYALSSQLNELKLQGQLAANLAGNYSDLAKNSDAIRFYIKADSIFELTGFAVGRIVTLNGLGLVQGDIGQLPDAKSSFKKALSLAQKLKHKHFEQIILGNLGVVYRDIGNVDSALVFHKAGLSIARELGANSSVFSHQVSIAKDLLFLGDITLAKEAIDHVISEDPEGFSQSIDALEAAGLIYEKLDLSRSSEFYEQAVEQATSNSMMKKKRALLEALAAVYEAQGAYEKALIAVRGAFEIERETFQSDIAESVSEANARFEAAEKTAALKEAQYLLERAETRERQLWLGGFSLIGMLLLVVVIYILNQKRIAERQRAEARVQINQYNLQSIESERSRIARELHDGIGQKLLLIKSDARAGNISEADGKVSEIIEEMRSISRNLYPPVIEKLGLVAAVRALLEEIEEKHSIVTLLESDQTEVMMSMDAQVHIYRIVQEATNNIIKHSKAQSLRIDIHEENGFLCIVIRDNGNGFDDRYIKPSVGLNSMQDRVEMLHGRMRIKSAIGQGTSINFEVPYDLQNRITG